ncbi:MAG: NUDIX domain-containing protein [Myxococcales bacterium]|nr:NUDIX domain-containing protein [Myxococcales bacterium]
MQYERSAGIIPFRRVEGRIEFLLVHSILVRNPDAAWEFPKGSIEDGETEEGAALREIGEEAHISQVTLLPDFRDEVHYTYRRHGRPIDKTIVFFVGEVGDWSGIPSDAPTREHGPHPHEGVWFVWGDERDTHRRLFHPGMRELLTRASYFLQAHDRIHGG